MIRYGKYQENKKKRKEKKRRVIVVAHKNDVAKIAVKKTM